MHSSFGYNLETSNTEPIVPDDAKFSADPTLFSFVDQEYQATVRSLIQAPAHKGLTLNELAGFRSEFGDTSFVCSVRTCQRLRVCFDSGARLAAHKVSQHYKPLKCLFDDCAYNDIGFLSFQRLHEHHKKRHGTSGPSKRARIPTKLKRKRLESDNGSLTENDLRSDAIKLGPSVSRANPEGTDPLIVELAEKASRDASLRDLMKRVALHQSSPDELKTFQGIIDDITAEYRRSKKLKSEEQNIASTQ